MSQIESPRQFLDIMVRGNCADFFASASDQRLALNSAIVVWHLSDWVWHAKGKNSYWQHHTGDETGADGWQRFCGLIFKLCPEMSLVHGLAIGTKHFRTSKAQPSMTMIPGRVIELPDHPAVEPSRRGTRMRIFSMLVVSSEWGQIEMKQLLRKTIGWWETFLDQHEL